MTFEMMIITLINCYLDALLRYSIVSVDLNCRSTNTFTTMLFNVISMVAVLEASDCNEALEY